MNRNIRSRSSRSSGGMFHAEPRYFRVQSQTVESSPPGSQIKITSQRYSRLLPGRLYRSRSSDGGIWPRTERFHRVCWCTPNHFASSMVPMALQVGRLMANSLPKNSSAVGKMDRRGMVVLGWKARYGARTVTLTKTYHYCRTISSIALEVVDDGGDHG